MGAWHRLRQGYRAGGFALTGRAASRLARRFERGVTSIEYALLGALIAVAILVSVKSVGDAVVALYGRVAAAVAALI